MLSHRADSVERIKIADSVERLAYSKNKNIFLSFLSAIRSPLSAKKSAIRYLLSAKEGFTLIELLIAVSLVGVIILAIVGVDLASRKFVNSADFAARAQNDISPALEHMVREISKGLGVGNEITSPTVFGPSDGRGIKVWVDDPTTPAIERGYLIGYRHDNGNGNCPSGLTGNLLRYCADLGNDVNNDCNCPGGWQIIATKLLPSDLTKPDTTWGLAWANFEIDSSLDRNLVRITLRARQNPAQGVDNPNDPNNPLVELTTTVAMRGVSAN